MNNSQTVNLYVHGLSVLPQHATHVSSYGTKL